MPESIRTLQSSARVLLGELILLDDLLAKVLAIRNGHAHEIDRSEMEGSIARWNRCHRSRSRCREALAAQRRRCEGDNLAACRCGAGRRQHQVHRMGGVVARAARPNCRRQPPPRPDEHRPRDAMPSDGQIDGRRCGSDHRPGPDKSAYSRARRKLPQSPAFRPVSFHDASVVVKRVRLRLPGSPD